MPTTFAGFDVVVLCPLQMQLKRMQLKWLREMVRRENARRTHCAHRFKSYVFILRSA